MVVIDLNSRRKGEHISGTAVCRTCGHEWSAAAPSGAFDLECPECHAFNGRWKHALDPGEHWVCGCGERLFYLTPKGARCSGCGIVSNDWAN